MTAADGSMGRIFSAATATVAQDAKAGVDWRKVKLDMGLLPSAGNDAVDFCADGIEFRVDLAIREACDHNPELLQYSGTACVMSKTIGREVLAAVQFNDELGSRALEISDIAGYFALTVDFDWVMPEKVVPQMPFMASHVFSQFTGARNKLAVVVEVVLRHGCSFRENPSDLAALGHLPYEGEASVGSPS